MYRYATRLIIIHHWNNGNLISQSVDQSISQSIQVNQISATATAIMTKETASLQAALDSILARLSCLESATGVQPAATPTSTTATTNTTTTAIVEEIAPSLTAYDQHITNAVTPFINACNAIEGLKDTGTNISTIFLTIRTIIEIGTQCKKPSNVQASIMPLLKPVQDAMGNLRQSQRTLDRKFDWHIKAIMEMLACVSWVIMTAPPAPSTFIKETIGASDFWANKIRKEYKQAKDAKDVKDTDNVKAKATANAKEQIAFCDTMKAMIMDLSAYVKEYHLSGLMWNPRGMAIEDYDPSSSTTAATASASATTPVVVKPSGTTPSAGDIMKELAAKRTSDGTSAATGLKKVSRDQQTWRKEFKADSSSSSGGNGGVGTTTTTVKPSAVKASQKQAVNGGKKKLGGEPVCKFIPVGSKWIVEYQTKESNTNGLCLVEVNDAKEQIYM